MSIEQFLIALKTQIASDDIFTDATTCEKYATDTSKNFHLPQAVVFAHSTDQVQKIVLLCNQYHIPLTTRGSGTGTTGAAVPIKGGIVLSCEKMQAILKTDPENRVMVIEAGVLNQSIQDQAAAYGFFWAPDPGSATTCTAGGNLACNASGPRAIKYGGCRENTLALTAVTGAGEIIHTGAYTSKSAVGYDLTRLLIGSEGTLAIITEATLKLLPLPSARKTLRALYSDIHSATAAVTKIMAQPVIPCALEFIDAQAIQLLRNKNVELPAAAKALLLIEIDGNAETLQFDELKLMAAAKNSGLIEIISAKNAEDDKKLWAARKTLSLVLKTIAPIKINEDIVVPVSQLPELISGLEKLSAHYQIKIVNFGHAGNGNIHVNLMVTDEQYEKAKRCLSDVFDLVLKLNGCLSGEHGIGMEKMSFITREIDTPTLDLMKKIKTVFDPNHIMNPLKLFPT